MSEQRPQTSQQRKKVLFVLTNTSNLGGKKTGWYVPECAHPFFVLDENKDIPIDIEFISPQGGLAPIDPESIDKFHEDPMCQKFLRSKVLMSRTHNTKPASEISSGRQYNAIYFVGGHGTMSDFDNEDLHRITRDVYEGDGIVASICHGPVALINCQLSDGKYLVEGKRMCSFTNQEEQAMKKQQLIPFNLQDELSKRGCQFVEGEVMRENVVKDGRLLTGQNPASGMKLGQELLEMLKQGG